MTGFYRQDVLMAYPSHASKNAVCTRRIRHAANPPVEKLALRLEIDLACGRRDAFHKRLQQALEAAYLQGVSDKAERSVRSPSRLG